MEQLHYLLMKTHTCLNRWILEKAAALGLSPGQPKVLECLMQNGESNQKAIAEFCEIEQATVGSILSRMERDGLIRRTQYQENRRSLYVSLTEEGRRKGELLNQIFREADALAVSALSQEQRRQFCEILKTVGCSLKASGKDGENE
ncbi:MarR family winged helix-turn-helix transcriptional regulator [uncultured Ruthenibacterium sp.]|uniref:MarR family winged helix-turn-helix transcriptional regulator n=1 Tax=uncultured Ruthenibacterium sp. TaxID=1905347 RepID=UPI00349EF91C